jgi:hypothetical protein
MEGVNMFGKTKDTKNEWVAQKMKKELGVDKTKADYLINEIKQWDGYNERLTDLLKGFPAQSSVPILACALTLFKPTGYLEIGRAPGRLAATYKREGAITILSMIYDSPDSSLTHELSKDWSPIGVSKALGNYYWILANALEILSNYCAPSEIQSAVARVEKDKNIWIHAGINDDIQEMLSKVRNLGSGG